MRRWIASTCLAIVAGCSLIYDQDRYEPSCTQDAECAEVDPLFVCDTESQRCVTCDGDGDGAPRGTPECAALADVRTPDCNDADSTQAPGNAPICGDAARQTCPDPAFSAVELLLAAATVEESGPLRLRLVADPGPGRKLHSFDVGAYPPTTELDDVDAVFAYVDGPPGERAAHLIELDLDGDYRSRAVDAGEVASADADFQQMRDVHDVQLRTLLIPDEATRDVLPGVGFGLMGTDEAGSWRVGGGAVMTSDAGPMYTPFASMPRPSELYGNLVLMQFTSQFLPAAVWREPGGVLVRVSALPIEGIDPIDSVTDPVTVPTGPARLHGTFGPLVIGEKDDDEIYWWDLVSPSLGTGMLGPRTGRMAVGYLVDESAIMTGALGDFLIAYPDGTDIVHQILACPSANQAECALGGQVRTPVRVQTSLFDMDLFALATVHETDGVQTVAMRILGMGPTPPLPLATSTQVNGRIDDLRVSISFADDLGLHIVVAMLVTPAADESRQVLWATGARLCGTREPMMRPMSDGGL